MSEEWKPIKNYEGLYSISSMGRVKAHEKERYVGNTKGKRIFPEKILKSSKSSNGYPIVTLCKKGKCKYCTVHRLVLSSFKPNPNNYPTVNHKNSIRHDNRLSNLEWATYSYQQKHSILAGLAPLQKGEDNNASKYKNDDILFAKELIVSGFRNIEIQEILDIPHGYISMIRNKKARTLL